MSKLNIVLLSLIIFLGITAFIFFEGNKAKQVLSSPVLGASKIRTSDNLWFPKDSSKQFFGVPEITAESAFFIDTNSGQVLFEKNSHAKLPAASLVKIMTVIVGVEAGGEDFKKVYTISKNAADMEPDHMLLKTGEKLTLEELLDGIFLVSANDGAEAIAEETTGSRDEFIDLMNAKAKQLGMNDTKFINPTGLEEDNKLQYSSSFDVALMSRYAIKTFPHLVDLSSQYHVYLPETPTHQDYDMYSGINLLTTYPGVVGFKTGFTPEAGLTLVTLARKNGKEVLGVILGATDRRDDARSLLDYSFKKLGI
ncbi:D-alanyl-D-alanine carboxypeptidase [Candidatus Daviesbacteria bacterium]|nr:D-alanyl-D-alanine carboxypeptidase [Candidatus Daviesbacteria bacterium]